MKKFLPMQFNAIQYCMIKVWRRKEKQKRKRRETLLWELRQASPAPCSTLPYVVMSMFTLPTQGNYDKRKMVKLKLSNEMLKKNELINMTQVWDKDGYWNHDLLNNVTGLWIFFVPQLSCWSLHFTHFIPELKIHNFYSHVTLTVTSTVLILAVSRTPPTYELS